MLSEQATPKSLQPLGLAVPCVHPFYHCSQLSIRFICLSVLVKL